MNFWLKILVFFGVLIALFCLIVFGNRISEANWIIIIGFVLICVLYFFSYRAMKEDYKNYRKMR